jgi:hypothetical protein
MEHETNPLQPAITISELNNRLKRMERLFAGTVLGGLASFVATLAFLHGQAPAEPPKFVERPEPADATFAGVICRNFTLVDENGMPRVEIDATVDGPSRIRMRDKNRYERYRMVADQSDQTFMEILDAKGTKRVVAGSLPDGVCGIDLADREGTTRMVLLVDEDNDCSMTMADGNELERISHSVSAAGNPISSWRDEEGEMRLVATVQNEYGGILDLNDGNRKTRVRTFCRNDGTAGTVVFDNEERHRIVMDCDEEGVSAVRWWDELKRLRLVGGTTGQDLMTPTFDVLEADDEKPSWTTPQRK